MVTSRNEIFSIDAAAIGIGFDAQGAFQMRAAHAAVADKNIAHAARNFAADADAAVAVLHIAIVDDEILAGQREGGGRRRCGRDLMAMQSSPVENVQP